LYGCAGDLSIHRLHEFELRLRLTSQKLNFVSKKIPAQIQVLTSNAWNLLLSIVDVIPTLYHFDLIQWLSGAFITGLLPFLLFFSQTNQIFQYRRSALLC
jgi:hypothetical protein